MNVWAIADLHLSFARPERRDRFAARWRDHSTRIEENWRSAVHPEDLVLLPGDISMAGNHRDLQPDLAWLDRLPGTKVLSAGNHDAWWNGVDRIRPMLRPSQHAVGGDALALGDVIVCGARGVPAPQVDPTPEQAMAQERGVHELEQALTAGERLRADARHPLYLLWHYPPFDRYGQPLPWVDRIESAAVSVCLYGHLHTTSQWSRTPQGRRGIVRYYCVAADAIGFHPLRIDSWWSA